MKIWFFADSTCDIRYIDADRRRHRGGERGRHPRDHRDRAVAHRATGEGDQADRVCALGAKSQQQTKK